jgi:hypothetical protein
MAVGKVLWGVVFGDGTGWAMTVPALTAHVRHVPPLIERRPVMSPIPASAHHLVFAILGPLVASTADRRLGAGRAQPQQATR